MIKQNPKYSKIPNSLNKLKVTWKNSNGMHSKRQSPRNFVLSEDYRVREKPS